MARGFNLTAELNLRGPNNIRPVIASIRNQLRGINVDVGVRVDSRATRDIAAMQQTLTRLNTTLQQTQTVATAASNSLSALARNVNTFNTAAQNLPRNINNTTAATNNMNNAMRQTNRTTQQAADGFESFGRQSALAIRRFAAFSVVAGIIYKFTNAIGSATSEFIDFNKELVRVAQVTDSSLSQLTPLVKTISSLSTGLGVTSKELISVSSTLAQAGLSARDTEKALKALALSALAPSFDSLNDTVEGSIALMRQFGIGADDLQGALGSVNAVAAKFAVEASDLITAIQRTGGVFAAASKGVSEGKDALNEFLAVFTSIRQTTRESAETIATGLRTIFTRIQRGKTIDALKEYGVVLTDLTGKFVGPYEAVRRLSEGLAKLDPRDLRFSNIVEELGGFRQIGKVIPLIQQFAVAQQALKVAQQGQASLANDAATAQLSVANRLVKVREEFNALIRSLGDSSTFQTFVKLSLDLASALIRLADSAKTVLPALTAIAAFRGASAITRFGAGFVGGLRRQNAGGTVMGFATGGYVPGVGDSDSVPAMLTPGEFVIRKKAVQAIGASNLSKINKYNRGGQISRFASGGIANAPMVDDILQTTGSILPKPSSAISSLIKAGGGGVDLDRAIKRTIGDKAYSKAPSSSAQQSVLTKYFLDGAQRLSDIQSAPLTSFGKELQTAIRSGKLKGSKISIISKSRRATGVPEYLSKIFGIPVSNMIFTQGADKQPAVDALRTKGPRAERVLSRYRGGPIKLAKGGDFLDKIEKGKTVGLTKDKSMFVKQGQAFGDNDVGSYTFGGIFLRPTGRIQNLTGTLKMPRGQGGTKKIDLRLGSLGADVSQQLEDNLRNATVNAIDTQSKMIAKSLGISEQSIDESAILKQIGFDNILGRLFEGVLSTAGGYFRSDNNAAFDFPTLPTNLAGKFGNAIGAGKFPIDAKSTLNSDSVRSILKKAQTEIINRNKAQQTSQSGRPNFGVGQVVYGDQLPAGTIKNLLNQGIISKAGSSKYTILKPFSTGGGVQKFREGGSSEDTVPALLTPGEFVINKKAANRIGMAKLHQLNKADKIQGFNKGGSVGHIQKFFDGGAALGLDSKDAARIKAAVGNNANLIEQFSEAVKGWPVENVGNALKVLARSLEKGASEAEALSSATSGVVGSSGPRGPAARKLRGEARETAAVVAGTETRQPGSVTRSGNAVAAFQATTDDAAKKLNAYFKPDIAGKALDTFRITLLRTGSNVQAMQAAMNLATKATMTYTPTVSNVSKIMNSLSSVASNAGKSLGKGVSMVGGGTINLAKGALGGAQSLLPTFMQRGGTAGAAARAAANPGGGMGGMGGMIATMAGGVVVDSISKSLGGEKTTEGRRTSSMGSQALNYGAMGAMIGSVIPGVGTAFGGLIGAAAGLTVGFFEAEKAGKEYAQAQAQAASELASEKSGKSLDTYLGNQTDLNRKTFLSDMKATTAAEDVAGNGITREKASSFGKFLGYKDEDARETAKRRVKTQQGGADQAEKFLAAEMMKSGKTFKELSSSMNPSEFQMLTKNIAEADQTYATVQSLRANEIEKLRASGKDAEANALQDSTNKELAGLATQIAERKLAEEQAAAMAKKEAEAKKQLILVTMRAVLSLEKTFQAMDQALNAVSFNLESAGNKREEMLSGKASLTSNNIDKDVNILQNPNAYSAGERANAAARSTAIMGSKTGGFVNRVANFASTARDAALQRANNLQSQGAKGGDIISQNTEIGDDVSKTLIDQIKATFGSDSAMAQTLINGVKTSVDKMVKEAGDSAINPEELVDAAAGPLIKASEKAGDLQIKALQAAQKGLLELGKTAEAVANLQQKQMDRTNNLKEMQRNSSLAFDETLGKKITPQDRINNRMQGVADRLGMANGQNVTANSIAQQKAAAIQEQQRLQGQIANQETAALGGDPAALRQLGNFQKRLAEVNNTIANADKELENLPQTLESNLGDLLNEIQKRVGEIEARKEAGANFAERLVTSTPQELAELNTTYTLLNRTLSGNIETINQSRVAQKSYYDALITGKTQQEAFADAQAAFANENKKALSLFNDLTQMSGVKGEQFDRMRADLLVNVAKSQGMGMENNPLFQKVIAELRKSPEERAQDDPGVKAMLAQAAIIRDEQRKAVQEQNAADRVLQNDLLKQTGDAIIKAIGETKLQIQVSVQRAVNAAGANAPGNAKGGLIYAADGQLINFQPKGTDTVPAMLTPGEFVVNAKATRENLPLLKRINSGYYASGGRVVQGVELPEKSDPNIARILDNTQFTRKDVSKQGDILSIVDKNTSESSKVLKKIQDGSGFSSGGVVYANKGQLINFTPKGTDTVPAMLTPGEFVVNAQATRDNLSLLQSINSGHMSDGGVVYAKENKEIDHGINAIKQDKYRSRLSQNQLQNTLNRISNSPTARSLKVKPDIASIVSFLQSNNPAELKKLVKLYPEIAQELDKQKNKLPKGFDPLLGYAKGGVVYAAAGGRVGADGLNTSRSLLQAVTANQMNRPIQEGLTPDSWAIADRRTLGDGVRLVTPRGSVGPENFKQAATTKANSIKEAVQNIKKQYPWFDNNKHKVISGQQIYNAIQQNLKKTSPADKYIDEIRYQAQNYPDIMQFKNEDLAADSAAIEDLIKKQALGEETAQILYAKATNRQNYLKATKKNQTLARNEIISSIQKNQQSKYDKDDKERAIGWLNTQRFRTISEDHYIDKIWDQVSKDIGGLPPLRPSNNFNFGLNDFPRAQWFARGGSVYAENGQLISYKPKGTDTVPAMLTPGEFVVNRQAAQANLPLLQSLNNGYSTGGQVAYLANGTPGTSELTNNIRYFTEILKNGADTLTKTFQTAITNLNKAGSMITINGSQTTNGVSNSNTANPVATINSLGAKLDRFIEQLQSSIPPVIKVEGEHQVNVVINGASILQNVLSGPLGNIVQQAVQSAFDARSRKNEGN